MDFGDWMTFRFYEGLIGAGLVLVVALIGLAVMGVQAWLERRRRMQAWREEE